MKKIMFLLLAAAALASCGHDESESNIQAADADPCQTVVVSMAIEGDGFTSGTGYEPMTRDEGITPVLGYGGRINNQYRYIVLKHEDSKWIIERIVSPYFMPRTSLYTDQYFTVLTQLPENEYSMDLRPGTYKLLALINAGRNVFNSEGLYEGMIVRDDTDPSVLAPLAAGYAIIQPPYTTDPRQTILAANVFAGVTDFTVEKREDLHTSPAPQAIDVSLTRRSSRFNLLFKEGRIGTQVPPITADQNIHSTIMFEAAEGYEFCNGIDVFGEPHYDSDKPRTYIYTRQAAGSGLHTASNGLLYRTGIQQGSSIHGTFFFTDESVTGGVPYTITELTSSFMQGQPEYEFDGDIEGYVLRHNTYDAISLTVTDDYYMRYDPINRDYLQVFYYVMSTDANGNHEQAVDLFDADYEWSLY